MTMTARVLSLGSESSPWKRFFSWWGGELQRLVPERWRGVGKRRGDCVIATLDGEALSLLRRRGNRCQSVGVVDLSGFMGDPGETVRSLLASDTKRGSDLVLRLDADRGLRRIFSLPLQVEGKLRQVLQHEMDRRTPWRADDVLFDYEVVGRHREAKRIDVRLTVVPRQSIDQALSQLRRVDLTPKVIDLLGDDVQAAPQINLLGGGDASQARGEGAKLLFRLAVITAIVVLAVIAFQLHQRNERLEGLREELVGARQAAEQSAQLRQEIERLQKQRGYLIDKKLKQPSVAVLMEVLSRLLPDDTWLVEFEIKGEEIRLLGYSAEASALLPLIEGAEQFFQVEFRSPVVRDYDLGADRFHISAKVAKGMALEP